MTTKILTKEELAKSEQRAAAAAKHIKSHDGKETIKKSITSAKKVKEKPHMDP